MVGMHIHIIPNRNSTPAVLLRESYRVGGNVRKRTLANLSKLPMDGSRRHPAHSQRGKARLG